MSAPLSDGELQRGVAALLFREGEDWCFPAGMTHAEEEARIYRAEELLAAEFGHCEAQPWLIGDDEDDPFTYSPQSGTLRAGPRRGKGVALGVLVCTFGIATAFPSRQPSRLERAIARPIVGSLGPSRWVPGWWDQASTEVEQALIRAAGCLADAGYEYVPDPVFDEPYNGRFADSRSPEMLWAVRYFGLHERGQYRGTASQSPSP